VNSGERREVEQSTLGIMYFDSRPRETGGWTFIAPLNQDCRHIGIKYGIILATYKRQLFKRYSSRI